ncbi:hypothetical protein SIID45300_01304 [Candidatus Magnetaquicoccaceae bacterium FCR-1]|uniref:Uncharacterized protein n=1 Tax=Candidatus Magnetaquiglobus chichijimensis TaxID=3141448 RepID=A0ABQ0C7X5_9PROT
MRYPFMTAATLLAGLIAVPVQAEESNAQKVETASDFAVSGNVALASNYVSRGITNSDKHPSLQGAATVSHTPSGIYATVSAFSVDFQAANNANLELDYAAGWSKEILFPGFKPDLGVVHYTYPGVNSAMHLDYTEYYLGGSYKFNALGMNAKYSYSSNFGGDNLVVPGNKSAYYLEGALTYDLPYEIVAAAHMGHTAGDHFKGTGAPESYNDYTVGLSKELFGFGVDLSYNFTDRDGRQLNLANSDDQAVLKVSKSF